MSAPPLSSISFGQVRQLLRAEAGIELGEDKHYLVNARLSELARELGLPCAEAVVQSWRQRPSDAELRRRLLEALTTNETFFFRDQHPFEALRLEISAGLARAKRAKRQFRVWSAACSTGQEPYSVAILQAEHFKSEEARFEIVATDFDTAALRRAREGSYRQHEVSRGLPPHLLQKYFSQRGSSWHIDARLKLGIEFRQLNLVQPWPPLGLFDVVLLRNVLIYFSQSTRQGILERVVSQLHPGGILMLGAGESLVGLDLPLERVSLGLTSLYRHRAAATALSTG